MIHSKKGMELSINFIVILILTIMIFGSSLFIASKIMRKTNELKASLDSRTEEQLASMINTGEEDFVIAIDKKECERGDTVTFGVALRNTLGGSKNFKINISVSKAIYTFNGSYIPSGWEDDWVWVNESPIGNIAYNDYKIIPIVFICGKTSVRNGEYSFNINSFYEESTNVWKPYPVSGYIKKVRIKLIS